MNKIKDGKYYDYLMDEISYAFVEHEKENKFKSGTYVLSVRIEEDDNINVVKDRLTKAGYKFDIITVVDFPVVQIYKKY